MSTSRYWPMAHGLVLLSCRHATLDPSGIMHDMQHVLSLCFAFLVPSDVVQSSNTAMGMADATISCGFDIQACLACLASLWPRAQIELLEHQGGCSITVLLTSRMHSEDVNSIVQLRPVRFAVHPQMAHAARLVHGELAPSIQDLGVVEVKSSQYQILRMSVIPGVSFSEVQPKSPSLDHAATLKMKRLLHSLAKTFADAWYEASSESVCSGRVGLSMQSRLSRLGKELPSVRLRAIACSALSRVDADELARLPVVLSHGDLLPSNMLVQSDSWQLKGLVDWAEAEYLPFGMSLYSIEHVLGYLSIDQMGRTRYTRYRQAQTLSSFFWQQLLRLVPQLDSPAMLQAVHLARDVGVLLWHGFAWNDGRINRVVNAKDDATELTCLDSLLVDFNPGVPESGSLIEHSVKQHINVAPIVV